MYTPKHFKINDKIEIFNFIHEHSFAILVSNNTGKLNASHIPVLLKSEEGTNGFLYGHVARANEQLRNIDEEVLVIFPGAHKYISPTWYETNQTVPTWNYLSVHVYGKIKILEEKDDKIKIIKDVVEYFEGKDSSYNVDVLKPDYFEGLLRGIVAFKIEITELQGKQKISQNHPEERQRRVINELDKLNGEDSKEIAVRMKNNLKNKNG
ncbi:MAG: FMN-binding negative transcriptional regulator [bacterium]